jgi:hypothetical protein
VSQSPLVTLLIPSLTHIYLAPPYRRLLTATIVVQLPCWGALLLAILIVIVNWRATSPLLLNVIFLFPLY